MNEIDLMFGPARVLGIQQLLCAMLASFVLAMTVATVYRWTYQGLSYSRAFVHTQVLAAIVTSILIMAIGNNLARGLGILGTLAIIRFRTPIRDPRDIIFLFACLAIGIASGAAVFSVAIVGTIFFCLVALYLHSSPFSSMRVYEGLLRFNLPAGSASREIVRDIFGKYCSNAVLVAMREAIQGEAMEFSYQIRLRDPTFHDEMLDELRNIEDITDVNILMHRATVEI
ncbi:MAG TPA: DUF4956 domain-containing protein [Verrucomicrobia bacterium]|nr:MAG: DUF4956 domain-containing protein [Lentisphaerae bacterium GWF2_57_35]HBA83496.1 DUF4956 domain-containing protein [Verrucomicrobiota bacterium]